MTSWALRTDVALACSCMLENLCDNIPCKTSPAIQSFMMILHLKVSYKGKIQCFFRRPWTISNQIHIFMYPSIYFLPYTIYSLAFVRSSICVFPQYIYTPGFSSWVFWHYPSIYTRVFHSPYQVNVRRLPIQHIRFGGSFLVYKKVKHIERTKEGKQKYNLTILFGNI